MEHQPQGERKDLQIQCKRGKSQVLHPPQNLPGGPRFNYSVPDKTPDDTTQYQQQGEDLPSRLYLTATSHNSLPINFFTSLALPPGKNKVSKKGEYLANTAFSTFFINFYTRAGLKKDLTVQGQVKA
jgi:hypothetical protein